MSFPDKRLRRLRENPLVRKLVSESTLLKKELVAPLFVKESLSSPVEISSMPGQFQHTASSLVAETKRLRDLGVTAVILFGIPARKDATGKQAAQKGVTQKAIAAVKKACPELLVIADVCLCEYMSHGHCGVVKNGKIDNDSSLDILSRVALSYAQSGADVVAPSDMMDGRVAAIRKKLDQGGFKNLPILSYAVKYASSLYSPFRDAAESAPAKKRGGPSAWPSDRKSYQMDAANAREALREAKADVEEGTDLLLVKPGLSYGDVIYRVKKEFNLPTGAYSVSGEYAMIKAAAQKRWIDEKQTVLETHLGMKRAGADFIITYWAKNLAEWRLVK